MKCKSLILLNALLFSGVILSSCSASPNKEDSIVTYKDSSDAKIGNFHVKIDRIESSQYYSKDDNGYKTKIYLRFTNNGENEQKIDIKASFISSEDDNVSFMTKVSLDKDIIKGNEIAFAKYEGAIATPLKESAYSFHTTINEAKYLLHLYDKPDSERKDFNVQYQIADQVVHSLIAKEGKIIGEDYIYENPNHLSYCNVWKTSDGYSVGSSTKVNSDLTANGVEKDNINFTQNEEEFVATSLDYIPTDKVVVVPNMYANKSVTSIADNFFFSKSAKAIYLPKTITTIGENNFYACSLLETINFEGTETEWNAINNLSIDNISDNVTINFETTF